VLISVFRQLQVFDLELNQHGPYAMRFTRNGRHLVLGGEKGHVGVVDWKTGALRCELHLGEKVRDVTWLHDETMFAVAQRR
jgi:U3 small nucleolar RNA-associated protein 7